MRQFEIRFCKGWDRSDVEIDPTRDRVEKLLRDQVIGQSCLGEVAIGCYYKTKDGQPTFKNSIDLSLYLGARDKVVISKDFDQFLKSHEKTNERRLLPIEGGEYSNIDASYFVSIKEAEELLFDLMENGCLKGEYIWGDPQVIDNIVSTE